VLPKKWNSEYFSAEENFQRTKTKRPNEFLKANQLVTRPEKGQKAKKILRRTNLKQGQISEIWPKKGQPGNPACDCHQVSGIFVSKAIL